MKRIALYFFFVGLYYSSQAQQNLFYWEHINEQNIKVLGNREIKPTRYSTARLHISELIKTLKTAPLDNVISAEKSSTQISLPMPDGSFSKFSVAESPVMEEALRNKNSNIKTYSIRGIDDIFATGKIDVTQFGFHGMIRSPKGDVYIDPFCKNNTEDYISYYTQHFNKPEQFKVSELDLKKVDFNATSVKKESSSSICSGNQLRTYRLAIACTPEYAIAATGMASPSVSDVLAKVVTSINRVNGVYETEVAVRMVLVSTTTLVLFTSAATSSFTPAENNDAYALIGKSQIVIDDQIGNLNYDIGHTFSTGAGGLADLGVVCNSSIKAHGVTGSAMPVGDPYDIDYVAHEMGHQFGANHTFNSGTGSCAGNRYAKTSVEPGSGVTLMAYAGLCGTTNNLENHSIAYFHSISFDEIMKFITTGGGNTCPIVTATGNNPPSVIANADILIAPNTAFTLTGTATDPEGDVLTYQWEEVDPGRIQGNWNFGEAPFFRSYTPSTTTSRSFPSAAVIASGDLRGTKGEYLPNTDEILNFRLVVRDNKTGGGGVCYSSTKVTVGNPTGITKYENINGLRIKISPNPFLDFIKLDFENNNEIDYKKINLTVFDILGNIVKQESNVNANYFKKAYDLSNLNSGTYYIQITNGEDKSVFPIIKL